MQRKFTLLLSAMILAICCYGSGVYATEDIRSAYINLLNGWTDNDDKSDKYAIYDIDKDGILEIIIDSGVASASILNFYTFANNEAKWLGTKEGGHVSLSTVPNENGLLRMSAHSSFQHVSRLYINNGTIEEEELLAKMFTPEEYVDTGYYPADYFYEGSKDLKFYSKSDLRGVKNIEPTTSSQAPTNSIGISTLDFDIGMSKGIQYFNNGLYYEARDEFQWFCDYNWGRMNSEQQRYALDYLGAAKAKVSEYETTQKVITQADFDAGMAKGINYYNKGMYKEARDEFQWFCDSNWEKMNAGQRKYALAYLDGAKREIQKLSSKSNSGGTYYHGGTKASYSGGAFWEYQYSLSISNVTNSSLCVNSFSMSQSGLGIQNAVIYKQSNGSYSGQGYSPCTESTVYITIRIVSNSHIKLTYGYYVRNEYNSYSVDMYK